MSPLRTHKHHTSHLSVRPEGEGADIRVMFADQATSGTRVLSGTIVHVAAIALLLLVVSILPESVYESILPNRLNEDIVYLVDPGPGGGGGGGNKSPDPPKQAEVKAQDKINVPVQKPEPVPVPEPEKIPDVLPEQLLNVPLVDLGSRPTTSIGDISGAANSNSRGSGTGSGVGPGQGSGLGPGRGGGTGGGVYDIGNGVSSPIPIEPRPKPRYTADAMRAKVQGIVRISAVVLPDGSVTDIRIDRSLDQSFGLDEEAKKTAAQWRFRPGMRQGEPVAVRILIELEFNLR